ncbi:MAG: hypothetical protein AAGE52_29610 [Myxococcota bacterium]
MLVACLDPVGPQSDLDSAVRDTGTDARVDSGASDASSDPDAALACVPSRWPEGPDVPGGTEDIKRFFALRDIVLDQEDRWDEIGWDIDGECTEDIDTRVCRRDAADAFTADGPAGLDNSFGENVLPRIVAVHADLEDVVRERMEAGETMIIGLREWNGTDTDPVLHFTMVRTAGLTDDREEPLWDGTDRYFRDEDGFIDGGGPVALKISDRAAYINDGVLVGTIPDRQPIVLPWLDGAMIGLPLLSGRVTARIAPDLQTLEDVWIQGRISIFDVRRMWDEAGFCAGEDIRRTVDAAVDDSLDGLINEGVGGDPFCDTISIAIQLRAQRAEISDPVPLGRSGQCE